MQLKSLAVLVSAAVATALSTAPLTHASDGNSVSTDAISISSDESATRWFVELAGPPTLYGVTPAAVGRERAAFRGAAKAAGLEFKDRFEYQTLWNGLSVEATASTASKLRAIPGVRAVYPVMNIEAPARPDAGSIGDVASAISQTKVDIARSELGLTGKNVKVAIIDTGIDYDHPDLGGCFGPGCKVAYGYDFVGNAYNAGDPNNDVPVPGDDPDDCNGHGTHVAGITGASAAEAGGVTGVAPEVTLGAYKVFGCAGSSSADVIVAALERAYADGMQVINQSLGAAFQWPQYPSSVVGDRLVEAGVVVIASAGNSGATGTFSGGAPGIGRDVIGVASYDNAGIRAPYLESNGRRIGYLPMTFSPPVPTSGTEEIVYIGRACSADPALGLSEPDPLLADPAGKVALAIRGTCAFSVKAANAVAAGATAVVIHNNVAGIVAGTLGAPPAYTQPVVGISLADGNFLRGLAAPAEITWTDGVDQFPNPTGNLISAFSSWGLSPDLQLKPDLGAPGGSIYATYPLELGGYATLSGTSMSAPHVAGAVALLLQAKPDTRAADVREILQNSSVPKVWSGSPGLGFLEPAHRQGAGMIDIVAAVTSPLHVSPGKLSIGEGEAGPQAVSLTVHNAGPDEVTLVPSFVNALSTTRSISATGTTNAPGPNGVGFFLGGASVAFGSAAITVPAGGSAVLDATVTPAAGPANGIYGGYIVMTPQGGGDAVRVPYSGFTGDYQAIQPLDGSGFGLPWLTRLEGGTFFNQPDGAAFTLVDGDVPYFLVHFGHHVENLEFEIVNAATGARVHPVFSNFAEFEYVGRNSTKQQFFAFSWDGTRIHSAGNSDLFKVVPNGNYRINVKALKALGDPSNPDHWQVWTSPTVTIARPEEPKKKTINLRGKGN
jgi:minor extracellular serine protease Vpr